MSAPVPPLLPGQPPIAFLVDYDGTIALTDVTDTVLAAHVTDAWEEDDALYATGQVGSRWLMAHHMTRLRIDRELLMATAAEQPHDPTFVPFARRATGSGIPVEIVSDGFGLFIEPALRRLGVPELPVVTAVSTISRDGSSIEYPNGNPDCLLCGTCKRDRVLAYQRSGRHVVFIGDGVSDRYAAGYADTIFAKRHLVSVCRELGLPFRSFDRFEEVERWLDATLAAWAADPAGGAVPAPRPRTPFCGAEVWGPGRRGEPGEVWPPR